jgi:hypothetical protein
MSLITQPLGVDIGTSDVMLLLSKVVEPVSPGIDTRMLFEGTLRLLVSFWLHDVMMPTKASIATM